MGHVEKAITVSGLSFAYNGKLVLDDVSTEIESGKLTFILGKNGSGKSTFLRILAGLIPYNTGKINILNSELIDLNFKERTKIMGFLSQQHKAVFPFLVEDVVLTGRAGYINFIPQKSDKQAALSAMERSGILHLKQRNYTELSGGEQQMVMIARVLAQEPKILLLDEPTTHLDFCNQSALLNLLKKLSTEGMTIVAVLHDPNMAFLFGDNYLFLSKNKIINNEKHSNNWDSNFLKEIYNENIITIPYKNKALLIPDIN